MYKSYLLIAALCLASAGCSTPGDTRSVTRLDATSVQSAEATFQKMTNELPRSKQQELVMAIIAINLIGVLSAHEAVTNPELRTPSIGRIKDRVAGMTAEEILQYAAEVSTVSMEIQGR
ncbi:DUF6694 family lipoprotein [Silanimonas sp.]|uniref:DUF6694 family lipoprotein n=1 Tax=Silanimonas sp. TaxID=1929290 RepID=UPI001BC43633|nr:DUF6694 family lipoprotein [Silanimonas sp.]MBS3895342.1 hypothetical protein [Silanimonas sp.]